ncbi:M48 family metallopeptidase [Thalassotalea sp. M1531]|uniref:M48 family metallopeptidase n=1 Tax=Thalassotalea algicola TaxID=2716224 RepID=A0A7Y0Q6Y2_9GAMM|nr:M48 family metallopeptidase [Thalassotalea algicola]NMP31893.1 M48 family metallopeptidase [Thalassotalea algicola]
MQNIYPATLYGAGSSQASTVNLLISERDVTVLDESNQALLSAKIGEIKVTPPLGKLPYEIQFSSGEKLVVSAEYPIASDLNHSGYQSTISVIEQHKGMWLLATLLVPLLMYFLIQVVIPGSAKLVTPLVPNTALMQVDKQVLTILDKTSLDTSKLSEEQQEAIDKQWQQVIEQLDLQLSDMTLNFRASELYGANAFALPGGNIVATDDLIALLGEQPDALTAVLLHEIGHVVHRHGMQMVAESAGTALLMTYFFGDLEGVAEVFSGTALTVIQNQFSQDLEREADDFAIAHLKRLGISPKALGDALSALSQDHGEFSKLEKYFSTHPQIHERVKKAMEHQ